MIVRFKFLLYKNYQNFYIFQLNEKFKEEDNPSVIYAISMSWFKEWENFVRGKTESK